METTRPSSFRIMDINGRIVKSGEIDGTLSIDDMDFGIYSIFLQSEDKLDNVKVIVQ